MSHMSDYFLAKSQELQDLLHSNQLFPPSEQERFDAIEIVRPLMMPRKKSIKPREDQSSFISSPSQQ